ncbi:MAG: terminase family protein [Archangium sp.]|nr:terminase family protein [Archangium sp.]
MAAIQDALAEGSLRDRLRELPPNQLAQLLSELPDALVATILFDWEGLWARQSQLVPPGDWNTWLILAGRGYGKTRTGAETVRSFVEKGLAKRIALVAPTAADVRDVMVEGESGLLACCPAWFKAHFEPSKRRITWKRGGREVARATLFSAEEPERFRGPQHDLVWGDEPASWLDPDEAWAQLQLGLRLGKKPRAIITGTPKPIDLLIRLLAEVESGRTFVTRGSTYENTANLAANFIEQIGRLYGNSRLGKQEIYGDILTAVAGIFDMVKVLEARVAKAPEELDRVVIAVDPAQNSTTGTDETGIVVVGVKDGHGYVLEDASLKGSPDVWASEVASKFHEWQAESVVAEVNVGGEMVEFTLRTVDASLPVKTVRAMRGKAKRAEPIAALFEQGKIHLVGHHPKLEKQMKTFTGLNGRRDDRTDAMCWGFHELLITPGFAFV